MNPCGEEFLQLTSRVTSLPYFCESVGQSLGLAQLPVVEDVFGLPGPLLLARAAPSLHLALEPGRHGPAPALARGPPGGWPLPRSRRLLGSCSWCRRWGGRGSEFC